MKALKVGEGTDYTRLVDDKPELLFGLEVEGKPQYGNFPLFYVDLNILDKILHNVMLNSGASHNLMPQAIMEKLNLDITRPYKSCILLIIAR